MTRLAQADIFGVILVIATILALTLLVLRFLTPDGETRAPTVTRLWASAMIALVISHMMGAFPQ